MNNALNLRIYDCWLHLVFLQLSILTDNIGNQIPAINNRNNFNNNVHHNNNNNNPPLTPSSPTPHQTMIYSHVQQRFGSSNSQPYQNRATASTTGQPDPVNMNGRKNNNNNNSSNGLRLFEKLTSAIYAPDGKTQCLGSLAGGKKKDVTSGTLYNLLAACLDSMPDGKCFSVYLFTDALHF